MVLVSRARFAADPAARRLQTTDNDVNPAHYGAKGPELSEWAAVAAAGVTSQVGRRVPADEWAGRMV